MDYRVSDVWIERLKAFEGCKLFAYRDAKGVPTIGYGHTGSDVRMGMAITQQRADELLRGDLAASERYVNGLGVCRGQWQFDALADFAYNCGVGNLQNSTLLRKIRQGRPANEIRAEFMKWVYSGGVKLNGLVMRRKAEADWYLER